MNSRKIGTLIMAGLILIASAAPAAHADDGPWKRWKPGNGEQGRGNHEGHGNHGRGHSVSYSHGYYAHDNAGPVLVSFIGGLVIGSQLNHHVVYASAPPACPYDAYAYYDPYSNRSYRSLDDCYRAMYDDGAPMVVEQIDVRSGRCVDTWHWANGGWCRGHDGNWSH